MVITGRVESVHLPEDSPSRTEPGKPFRRPSEHEPYWQEAVIDVERVHKGSLPAKQVIVRFPGSHDIVWAHIPKLQPGMEGHFVLHRTGTPSAGLRATRAATDTETGETYLLTHADDFQSLHEPEGITPMLRALGGTEPGSTDPDRH